MPDFWGNKTEYDKRKEQEAAEKEKVRAAQANKEIQQGLERYGSGQFRDLSISGTEEQRRKVLEALNFSNVLYGQNAFKMGEDVQGLKSEYEQLSKGMDPISAAIMQQSQGTVAKARREAASAGMRGPASMGAVANAERQGLRDVASSLYGQSTAAMDKRRQMLSGMISGTAGQKYGAEAVGAAENAPVYQPTSSLFGGMFGSVLCTELHAQGILDSDIYAKDAEYGVKLYQTNPEILVGYHFWAVPLVRVMRKSKLVTNILKHPVLAWANHISGTKENFFGRICVNVGQPICGFIGKLILGNKDVRKTA